MLQRTVHSFTGIFLVLGCALGSTALTAATPPAPLIAASRSMAPDAGELINESGRLRMLTERMGKAYAQTALNVMPYNAREQIAQSEKRFNENLVLLGKGATTPELKAHLDSVTVLYKQYLQALGKPAEKANVAAAHRLTDQLVAEAEKLTAAFDAKAHVATARIVNVSGRQRMLSQRMARLYFSAVLSGNRADTERYRVEFKDALAMLESAPLSSKEIKRELELAKTQWLFFEQALLGNGDMANGVKNIATTSERLLEIMDNLTSLYSTALKAVSG